MTFWARELFKAVVLPLQEDKKNLQTAEAKLSDLQEQVEALSKFKMQVEGNPNFVPSSTDGVIEESDTGAIPMATDIPAPPPLPPIMDPDGVLIPPPPPLPFGEWIATYMQLLDYSNSEPTYYI